MNSKYVKLFCFILVISSGRVFSTPSHGETCVPLPVTFSWNSITNNEGQETTAIELSLSTANNFNSITGYGDTIIGLNVSVTSYVFSGVPATTYYWRLEYAVVVRGSEGSFYWSSIDSFTTASAPTLSSPSNGAANQPVALILSWNSNSCASSYDLQVSTNSSFSSTLFDYPAVTSLSQIQSGLLNGTTYYWRTGILNDTMWSPAWSFTTSYAIPGVPALISPSNGSTGQSPSPSLTWNAVAGVTGYTVQVSTSSGFSTTVLSRGLSATSESLSGLSNFTQYYWRACGVNPVGSGPWCGAWSFTTIFPAPTLAAPTNGAVNQAVALTLSWNKVTGATSYGVQLSAISDFSATFYSGSGLTSNSQAVSGLVNNSSYYWRANAVGPTVISLWSAAWSFSTILAVPQEPQLVSPSNGAQNEPISLSFSWNSVANAASYNLQFSTTTSFSSPISVTVSVPSESVDGFTRNTDYFWRVNATNIAGNSPWSSIWSFYTQSVAVLSDISPVFCPSVNEKDGVLNYSITEAGAVRITVYTLLGKRSFAFNQFQNAGRYSLPFHKAGLSPGSYVLYFNAPGIERSIKICDLK